MVADTPIVLASGALGLISIPDEPRRLTREQIDGRYPALVDGLVDHPEIGFVLVRSADGTSLVLGDSGTRNLHTGEVDGVDRSSRSAPTPLSRSARSMATARSPT